MVTKVFLRSPRIKHLAVLSTRNTFSPNVEMIEKFRKKIFENFSKIWHFLESGFERAVSVHLWRHSNGVKTFGSAKWWITIIRTVDHSKSRLFEQSTCSKKGAENKCDIFVVSLECVTKLWPEEFRIAIIQNSQTVAATQRIKYRQRRLLRRKINRKWRTGNASPVWSDILCVKWREGRIFSCLEYRIYYIP